MKVWMVVLIALLTGGVLGYGQVHLEFGRLVTDGLPGDAWNTGPKAHSPADELSPQNSQPIIAVGSSHYNFGSMQRNTTQSHIFVLKNVGSLPVGLEKGDTTCKCTLSELEKNTLQPGETCEVALEWTPKSFADEFFQTADIKLLGSHIQEKISLTIGGRVIQIVRPVPDAMTFHNVSVSEGASALLRIYSFSETPFEITACESVKERTADYFSYSLAPLSSEDLALEKGAVSGVGVRVAIQPGLPLGPAGQTIRITTNIEGNEEVLVPLQATVVSDISLLGGLNFKKELSLLILGVIDGSKGAKAKLRLLVKGPYRHDIQLKVVSTKPAEILKAHIGEPKEINNGVVVMYPLDIEIVKGSSPANFLGSGPGKYGKILIETTHPNAKTVPVYLKFLIRR